MDTRLIHTRIWEDEWFALISPLAKLLFLYCIVNKEIKATGAFEKTLRLISFDTAIPQNEITFLFEEIQEKVTYQEGWVFVKNTVKYNNYLKPSASENQKEGVFNEVSRMPESIRQLVVNHISTSYQLVDDQLLTRLQLLANYTKEKKKKNSKKESEEENGKGGKGFNDFAKRMTDARKEKMEKDSISGISEAVRPFAASHTTTSPTHISDALLADLGIK